MEENNRPESQKKNTEENNNDTKVATAAAPPPESPESPRRNSEENNHESGGGDTTEEAAAAALSPPQEAAPAPETKSSAVPYRPRAMLNPHHGFYPPHYIPYQPYLHFPPLTPPPNFDGESDGENRTIWVGNLHHMMDEDYLFSCFASTGEVAHIKVIRNKQTGISEGYGFVEFFTHLTAERVLQSYPFMAMPNTDQPFHLNWATFSNGNKQSINGPDLSIFVGDLAADVTDELLNETFSSKYPSVKGAKVVTDLTTGRSKGYGFVRFGDDDERSKALTEMNGVYCSTRPMRVGEATARKSFGQQQGYSSQGGYSNGNSKQGTGDSVNTTIFVGGLDSSVTGEDLRQPFSQYGEIVSVKIPAGKGCGFVEFANRNDAEEALKKLHGTTIGKQIVRLSWGRNHVNRQARADFANQWNGPYGDTFFNGSYGYAFPPPHNPRFYANAPYGPYPMYGTHIMGN